MRKISDQVESILQRWPETRSSDKELEIIFMETNGLYLTLEQKARFKQMPSMETVRRVRQKIQQNGKYPATEKVQQERNFKAMQVQQIEYKAGPAYIANTLEERL